MGAAKVLQLDMPGSVAAAGEGKVEEKEATTTWYQIAQHKATHTHTHAAAVYTHTQLEAATHTHLILEQMLSMMSFSLGFIISESVCESVCQ